MKHACPYFACVQIASWLFIPNLYVDVILDKLVHSFHATAHLRSSGYWNEADWNELENAMTYVNQQTTLHDIKLRSGMLFFIA